MSQSHLLLSSPLPMPEPKVKIDKSMEIYSDSIFSKPPLPKYLQKTKSVDLDFISKIERRNPLTNEYELIKEESVEES